MNNERVARLSIVVPTHNTAALTTRCLETLFENGAEGDDCEVIVVDDGSSDGTAAALTQRFPTITLLRNESAEGFSRAANRGLERATGELLWLLNSDTEVPPGCIPALRGAFANDSRLGIAGAQLYYADGSAQWSAGREPTRFWLLMLSSGLANLLRRLPLYRAARPLHAAQPTARDWVSGAAMAIRREAWEAVGPFDTGFQFYGQDLDLCRRVADAGWRVELRPDVRVLHHHGATIANGRTGCRQNHRLLWTDLLFWANKRHGPEWASHARSLMACGARARLLGRALVSPLIGDDRRTGWTDETAALRSALQAIKSHRGDTPTAST